MKIKVMIVLLLLVLAGAAVWYLKSAGVTHEDIREAVVGESAKVQETVDDRYRRLER